MKKLLLLIPLLVACATAPKSEYRKGCEDGVNKLLMPPDLSKYEPGVEEKLNMIKAYICNSLEQEHREKSERAHLKSR